MVVLGRSKLEHRLREGVFVEGTWSVENLRGAAYDLRIARDYLILPNGRRYWENGPEDHRRREAPFPLPPGSVAFVSSVEVLVMPEDLAGNIATKFRKALDGILVMGGFLVDPGYRGRLHFQLANIGRETLEIVPEETSIAALQLLPVEGDADVATYPPPRTEKLLDAMFNSDVRNEPLRPLAFFTLSSQTETLEKRLDEGLMNIEVTKRSTDRLIVFGLIVIFAAILAGLIDRLV